MLFNLNEFLMSLSFALDFVEMDILGMTSNHGKRVAHISLMIGKEINLSSEELHDIVALAILHDNGLSEKSLHDKLAGRDLIGMRSLESLKIHCTFGEDNAIKYPFLTDVRNVIKYHHETYDGKGYFNLTKEQIPLMSQIIWMADQLDRNFDLKNNNYNIQNEIYNFIKEQETRMFSPEMVKAFSNVAKNKGFWMELRGNFVEAALKKSIPQFSVDLPFERIHNISQVFSKIIDSKSKFTQRHSRDLSEKVSIMADYYSIKGDEKLKLIIASDLHDIGKLAVPNSILDSANKLTFNDFEIIKEHSYYTRLALQEIKGFEDITEWASNHHEKLNGEGYPYGKTGQDLDFNSRIIACLDIYEALTEERPYRKSLSHNEAMEILNRMKNDGFIDGKVTDDINYVFKDL